MSEESISQQFRRESIDETRYSLIEDQNELMSKKHKKFYRVLIYIEHLLISISTVTGCVSISSFAFLVGISSRNKTRVLQ